MAKSSRGGLGRGLNSLLGGSYDEAIKPEPSTQRVVVEAPELNEAIEEDRAAVKARAQKISVPIRQNGSIEDEFIKEDDHVVIKKVVERSSNEVPIEAISPNPDQPRTNFKQEEIEELAASIEKDGLLQPILVRPVGDHLYQIIAGERRWQACRSIGVSAVPVRIKDADDDKALELALIENIQRSDLNPIEEAYGYRRMMERRNLTQSEVAQMMSKGRSTVANALRLLELPEDAQKLLFEEKITAGHARAILSIPSQEGRQKLTEKLLEEKLSVRETETIARLLAGKQSTANATPRQPTPKSFKKVAKALRNTLNTNVRVKTVQGKNKIEIEFKDEEDLARIFEELTASE